MIYKSYLVEQNINSISQNLVLFYGENLGLKDDFKDIIKKNNKDTYIKNFDQDQILSNKIDFINELFNESLFEEKKIFFINNANDKLLKLIQEIELKTNLSKIYFFSDILDKKSKLRDHFEKSKACAVIACYTDNEISIKKIIQNKLKNFTGLTSDNINIIFDNCNFDRIKLNNELSKILSYFDKKNNHRRIRIFIEH